MIPSDYAVEILRDDHLLESIDTTEVCRTSNIVPASVRRSRSRQLPSPDPGKTPEKKFTIPYQ